MDKFAYSLNNYQLKASYLKNLGIKVDKYYASEIDKYAIKIAKKNFPNTIHLGDVKDIDNIDDDIDLLLVTLNPLTLEAIDYLFEKPRSLVNQNISEVRLNWMGRKRLVKEE